MTKTCPRCFAFAEDFTEIEAMFGWRRINGDKEIPQSYCRDCRKNKKPARKVDTKWIVELSERIKKFNAYAGTDYSTTKLIIKATNKTGVRGLASARNWIKLSLGVNANVEGITAVLIHEYAHIFCYQKGWLQEKHGPRFRAAEKAAMEEFLGEELVVTQRDIEARGAKRHHMYAQISACERILRERRTLAQAAGKA